MACPFCALGCRDGQPRIEEVNRNWRFRQLTAHPDHGGNTEAAAFLNTTKEYAISCIKNTSSGKPGTINCPRHGIPSNEVPSSTYPKYHHHSTASTSNDMVPPPRHQQRGRQNHTHSQLTKTPGPLAIKQRQAPPEGYYNNPCCPLLQHFHFQGVRHSKRPHLRIAQPTPGQSSPRLPSLIIRSMAGIIRHLNADGAVQKQHTAAMDTGLLNRHKWTAGTNQEADHGRASPLAKTAQPNIMQVHPPPSTMPSPTLASPQPVSSTPWH